MNNRISIALAELYDDEQRDWLATADYTAEHGIDINAVAGFCGLVSVRPIVTLPHRRFDFPDGHGKDGIPGVIIEARAKDGETVVDLVAWPTASPRNVCSLLGQVAILGSWQAFHAGTYIFGRPLRVHQTALAWLQAGCDGLAVITPKIAERALLDVPGPLAAADTGHAAGLKRMIMKPARRVEILIPAKDTI